VGWVERGVAESPAPVLVGDRGEQVRHLLHPAPALEHPRERGAPVTPAAPDIVRPVLSAGSLAGRRVVAKRLQQLPIPGRPRGCRQRFLEPTRESGERVRHRCVGGLLIPLPRARGIGREQAFSLGPLHPALIELAESERGRADATLPRLLVQRQRASCIRGPARRRRRHQVREVDARHAIARRQGALEIMSGRLDIAARARDPAALVKGTSVRIRARAFAARGPCNVDDDVIRRNAGREAVWIIGCGRRLVALRSPARPLPHLARYRQSEQQALAARQRIELRRLRPAQLRLEPDVATVPDVAVLVVRGGDDVRAIG